MLRVILAFIISLTISAFSSATEVYKWIDEKGITHFTDNPAAIPEYQRKNTQTRIFKDPLPSDKPDNTASDTLINGRFSITEDVKYRKLSWDDFKGPPNYNNPHTAETSVSHTYQTIPLSNGNSNIVNIKVSYEFNKYRAWVKSGGEEDEGLLRHEQGHYNIGFIYAKELFNNIKKLNLSIDTYEKEIKKVYNNVMSEYKETDNRYENETDHSQNRNIQERWNKVIDEWIEKYL